MDLAARGVISSALGVCFRPDRREGFHSYKRMSSLFVQIRDTGGARDTDCSHYSFFFYRRVAFILFHQLFARHDKVPKKVRKDR